MKAELEVDLLDQREVVAQYGPNGKIVSAYNERGEVVVGSEAGVYLWWKTMMDVLRIPIVDRVWKRINRKNRPKTIGGE